MDSPHADVSNVEITLKDDSPRNKATAKHHISSKIDIEEQMTSVKLAKTNQIDKTDATGKGQGHTTRSRSRPLTSSGTAPPTPELPVTSSVMSQGESLDTIEPERELSPHTFDTPQFEEVATATFGEDSGGKLFVNKNCVNKLNI